MKIKNLLVTTLASTMIFGLASNSMASSYIGLKGGNNNLSFPEDQDIATNHTFGNLHAGYFVPIGENMLVGSQIGGTHYGKVKTDDDNVDFYSLNLFAVAEYIMDGFYIDGRFGGVIGLINSNNCDIEHAFYVAAGAGFGYYLTQNLSGGFSYDHVFGKDYQATSITKQTTLELPEMDLFGVQLTYHF